MLHLLHVGNESDSEVKVNKCIKTLKNFLNIAFTKITKSFVYEEEVDRAVEGLTALIEPLMIMFLAGVIGTIVVALFAPLVKMIDKLGG